MDRKRLAKGGYYERTKHLQQSGHGWDQMPDMRTITTLDEDRPSCAHDPTALPKAAVSEAASTSSMIVPIIIVPGRIVGIDYIHAGAFEAGEFARRSSASRREFAASPY